MPKKSKKALKEESATPVSSTGTDYATKPVAPARSNSPKSKKNSITAKKPAAAKTSKPRKAAAHPPASHKPPSIEEIQLRAYFIAERRHRLNLPGDSNSDWIEAVRQFSSHRVE